MNYLAHLLLSGKNEQLLIGNFIADAIKGNDYLKYPKTIQNGIVLHRFIDDFTDSHDLVRQSTALLHAHFHHYSGVVTDIYYDHFLSLAWNKHSTDSLRIFSDWAYQVLNDNRPLLPEQLKPFLDYLIRYDQLFNYGNLTSLERVFKGMAKRVNHPSGMENGVELLKIHYSKLNTNFDEFFPLLAENVEIKKQSFAE